MKNREKINIPEVADSWCKSVIKQITFIPDRGEIYRELASHIQDIAEDYKDYENMSEKEAYAKAVERMGDAEGIGRELNKQHKPGIGIAFVLSKIASVVALVGLAVSVLYGAINVIFLWDDVNVNNHNYELFEHKDLEKLYEFSKNNDHSQKYIDLQFDDSAYYYEIYETADGYKSAIIISDSDAPIYNIEKLDIIEPCVNCKICDFQITVDKVKVGTMPEVIPDAFADVEGVQLWRDYICQLDISAKTFKLWNQFDFLHYVEIYDDKGDKVDFEYEIQRNSMWEYDVKIEIDFDKYLVERPQYVDFTLDKGDYDILMRIPLVEREGNVE